MWWTPAAIADVLPPLPRAGEVPEVRWYARVDEVDGRLSGRWQRRRDAEHALSVLPDGLVVRWVHTTKEAVLDHQRDAAGRPLATVRWEQGAPVTVIAHGPTDEETHVTGWSWVALPGGGATWLPAGATSGSDLLTAPLLGGQLRAELVAPTDPFAPAFVEGLLDGCVCVLFDRGTVWVDDRPAARHAVLLPPPDALPGLGTPALVELWAVPRGERLLVLTWQSPPSTDPVATSRLARAVAALVDFDREPGGAP
jgi:hypothetical protein